MADRKAIVGSVARRIASIKNIDEGASVVAVTAGGWTPETTTQRSKGRSQVLWMVDQARRAAENERVDDARWWRARAIRALWNMS